MVEFGLKLEDNKVAEWSEHYLAYADLKDLLKKVKQTIARYEDHAKKKPALAKEIKANYDQGTHTFVTKTPPASSTSLASSASLANLMKDKDLSGSSQLQQQQLLQQRATENAIKNQKQNAAKSSSEAEAVTETTSLLHRIIGTPSTVDLSKQDDAKSSPEAGRSLQGDFGSTEDQESQSQSGVQSVVTRAVSSVSGYFEKRYETILRDYLKDIDALQDGFDQRMETEADKVNKFYGTKLEELEKRLSLLECTVLTSLREKYSDRKLLKHSWSMDDESEKFDRLPKTPAVTPLLGENNKKQPVIQWKEFMAKITKKNSKLDQDMEKDRLVQQSVLHIDEVDEADPDALLRDKTLVKKISEADSIQRALVDQYRTSKLLHNFAIMNYTGFVKIAKKHDKTLPHRKGKFKELIKVSNICNEGIDVEKFAERVELRYANWFCDGNHREAIAQLLPKRGDGLETDWSQLRLGYRMGMCAVLGLWVCWDCVWGFVSSGHSTIGGRTAFPVFRACGGLLILQWFWGCSVFIWTRFRVNYIYLFDFDPRIVSSPLTIFNEAVDNSLVFLWCMLLYYKSGAHDIPNIVPSGTFPFVLVIYTVMQCIFPLRTRVPMWKSIWAVITSPSTAPSFYHGYVGDIFTSMVKVFQDLAWTICFIISGDWLISEDLKEASHHKWARSFWYKNVLMPLICLLPLLFRFNQCLRKYMDTGKRFPHLANAAKYALSQTVTLFGAFHPLYLMHKNPNHNGMNLFQVFWMFVFVASSLYSFTWDVLMDWGLGRPKYKMLGPRLMYPKQSYYYYVIAIDLVLRFMWVLTLLPPNSGAKFEVPHYLTAMVMMLELFRRTIWGFLRLENEHRSNTAGFRRVSFVPLHFNTGHNHQYKEESKHRGSSVLAEVAAVATIVMLVCVYSVVAAQRATRSLDSLDNSDDKEL